jgi:hypothetical protein
MSTDCVLIVRPYTTVAPTALLVAPLGLKYVYAYQCEALNYGLHREVGLSQPVAVATAGGISGSLAWFISLPLDTIKSVVQGEAVQVETS